MISEPVTQVSTGRLSAAAGAGSRRATRELGTSLVSINHDNVQLRPRPSSCCQLLHAAFFVGEFCRDKQLLH